MLISPTLEQSFSQQYLYFFASSINPEALRVIRLTEEPPPSLTSNTPGITNSIY